MNTKKLLIDKFFFLLIDEKKIKHFSNINVTLNYFVSRA